MIGDIYHDMKRYWVGRPLEGHNIFDIPLKPDGDGMVGRECPNTWCQPRYFKMSMKIPDGKAEMIEDISQIDVTCPYCGTVANMQNYHTRSQLEWVKSMIIKDVTKTIQNTLENSFKPIHSASSGMFSVNISYKPDPLPSVRHYIEEKLKRTVTCDNCGYNYAVYGISFHCPLCGEGNLTQHLNRSAEIIKIMIEEAGRIGEERGQEIEQQMIGNALEDVVGLFEAFLKHIYQYKVRNQYSKEEAEIKIRKIHVNFQRLDGATALFHKDLDFELFAKCNQKDIAFLQEQFLKRHILTHNLGLVDRKYMERAHVYAKQGTELNIGAADVLRVLEIVVDVVTVATQCLGNPT